MSDHKSATPSDNLNKAVEEILHHLTNQAYYSDADYAEATQALLEIINNEKIAWEQKPVGDAIEIDVPAKTMQFVMSKIKLKPKTIASRTLTPEWVVELWLNGKGDKYDLQVYIWKLKILASLTHRYNWTIFLLKPENLPTQAINTIIDKKCNESRIDELKQVQQCGHNTQAVQFRIDTLKGQL